MRFKHNNTSISNLGFHIVWIPKYRRKLLINGIDRRLKILLYEKSKAINVQIESLEVMPDHVHLFVKTNTSMSPSWIVNQLKGYTSKKLRDEYSFLKKLPSLWVRSYYIESVGHISEKTIKKYIKNQKTKP